MFDGVGWAAGEIVVFMLIATLIGFAIGWIFGRWLQRGTIAESYEAELAAERDRTKKAESRLSESNKKLDTVYLDLKGEQAKLEGLEQKDAEIASLTAELAARSEVQPSAGGDADAELNKVRGELAACATERDALTSQIGGLEDDIGRLEGDIGSRDRRIAQLEVELSAAPEPVVEQVAAIAQAPVAVSPLATETVEAEPTKEEGLAKIAEIAERTAGGGPAQDDDLKKVHGIGPKLERTLKGLGITSFRQIANFQPEDIVFVTAALDAFKGRIERDDWMSSAAEQHTKKYNEPA